MKFTKAEIEKYFTTIRDELLNPKKRYSLAELRLRLEKSTGAGVYCIFDSDKLCYVGETGSLFGRFKDFGRTLNHTFRRSLGAHLFKNHPKYSTATSLLKFDTEIELALDAYIEKSIRISVLPILIGRKEFEDWMQENNPEVVFLNKRKKRV